RSGPGVELAPYGGYDATVELGAWTITLGALVSLGGVDVGDSPPLLSITGAGVEADPGLDLRTELGVKVDLDQVDGGQGYAHRARSARRGALRLGDRRRARRRLPGRRGRVAHRDVGGGPRRGGRRRGRLRDGARGGPRHPVEPEGGAAPR